MTEGAWLTARELAGLPGMPGTEFRTRDKLQKLGVPSRLREGRVGGGGREYCAAHLPAETRAALLLPAAVPAKVPSPLPPAPVATARPPSKAAAACADARVVLLQAMEHLAHLTGSLAGAADALAGQISAGTADAAVLHAAQAANARARKQHQGAGTSIGARTLWRWHGQHKLGGWEALLPADTKPQPVQAVEPDVAAVLRRYASTHGAARILSEVAQQVNAELGNPLHQWRRLYDRARRALGKVDKVALVKARHSGAEQEARLAFTRRGTEGLAPLDAAILDGHSWKGKVRHPDHGAPFVPEVSVVLDVKTRLILGWSASLSESTMAVGDAVRHGVSQWGKPAIIYSDNGPGESAKYFDCELTGLYARLGITHKLGRPRSPQGHGAIERSWRTHMIRAARQFDTYHGTGADQNTLRDTHLALAREQRAVKRAQADGRVVRLTNKVPTWQQFLDAVAAEVERYNTTHRHRSLPKHTEGPLAGQHWTPMEAMRAWLRPEDQVRIDGPTLRAAFMPAMPRTAQRGEVRLLNNLYFSPVLQQFEGEKVICHFDIHDPQTIWVYSVGGDFICEAGWNANKRDFFPKAVVQMAREKRVADAVKRREAQIATAQRELQPTLPTPEPGTYIGDLMPAATAGAMAFVERVADTEPEPQAQLQADAGSAPARPFFDSPAERYEWLMQHPQRRTPDDEPWLQAWVQTDDYAALQHYFAGRGIAWPDADDPTAFKTAG